MIELLIAVALIALNGVFSLSELAVVSARKARLRTLADQGKAGATAALALAEDPGRFLSTVQIGITLIGILAGAFSGAALGQRLTDILLERGLPNSWAEPLGYGLVISAITFLSVVVGELVPKNLALANAELIACFVSPAMRILSRIVGPIVWALDGSTKLVFRLFGKTTEPSSEITDEEIRTVMAEAKSAGVIEGEEHEMISGVLRLGDRDVRALMTPRAAVEWIDIGHDEAMIRKRLLSTTHSRLPVSEGGIENIVGVLQVRDLVTALLQGSAIDVRTHLRQAVIIPDTLDALDALTKLREAEVPMALVYDEYGHLEGIVTPADILDAITGAFRSDEDAEEQAVRRADGSWLISGWMPADEMADRLGLQLGNQRGFATAAGFVLSALQHLPSTGEKVAVHGWEFEVVDLDGRRIDKLLVRRADGVGSS